MSDLRDDETWLVEQFAAIDTLEVPPGDLDQLLSRAGGELVPDGRPNRSRRPRRFLAAAAAIAILAAGGYAAVRVGDDAPEQLRVEGGPEPTTATSTSISTTLPPPPIEDIQGSADEYLAGWEANTPVEVGGDGVAGFILPDEVAGMEKAVQAYATAHGHGHPDDLGTKMVDALRVRNGVEIRDADGIKVGWWAGRFIALPDFLFEQGKAITTVKAYEEDN